MELICIEHKEEGFTLVELLITLVISGLIMGAVYSGYQVNQKVYNNEQSIVEVQQSIRAAMSYMVNDIRMAGYDPTGNAGSTICVANRGEFRFTQDLDDSGTTSNCASTVSELNENIAYGFSATIDADRNGIPDAGEAAVVGRLINGAGGFQEIASDISAIEFNYVLDDGSSTTAPANLGQIVKVQVSILAQSGTSDSNYNNTLVYTTVSGATWGPFDDNIRRRLLTTTIHCRNMGL